MEKYELIKKIGEGLVYTAYIHKNHVGLMEWSS